jgi:hypothetical protein
LLPVYEIQGQEVLDGESGQALAADLLEEAVKGAVVLLLRDR